MNNYKLHIDKNSWISQNKTEVICGLHLEMLSPYRDSRIDELCGHKTMCHVYEEGVFYEEYDEFFFQAENAEEALNVGIELYKTHERANLPKINKYALRLFFERRIDYDAALNMNEDGAYELYNKIRKSAYHLSFEEPEKLKVWFFDTVGSCVYGQAIVVAKDKGEAIRTLREYTSQRCRDISRFCLDPVEKTELRTSLIEPKVIEAWYEEC